MHKRFGHPLSKIVFTITTFTPMLSTWFSGAALAQTRKTWTTSRTSPGKFYKSINWQSFYSFPNGIILDEWVLFILRHRILFSNGSCSDDNTALIIDIYKGKVVHTLRSTVRPSKMVCISFSNSGNFLATANEYGVVDIWSVHVSACELQSSWNW